MPSAFAQGSAAARRCDSKSKQVCETGRAGRFVMSAGKTHAGIMFETALSAGDSLCAKYGYR
jgi:hypothetical protein